MNFCIYLPQWYLIQICSLFCYFGLLEHGFSNKLNFWHTELEYGLYSVGQSLQYPNALSLMSLETHQFGETNLTHSCFSSAGIHLSEPKARAKALGERLAWDIAKKPVMGTEPPLSALQNQRAQRAWLTQSRVS